MERNSHKERTCKLHSSWASSNNNKCQEPASLFIRKSWHICSFKAADNLGTNFLGVLDFFQKGAIFLYPGNAKGIRLGSNSDKEIIIVDGKLVVKVTRVFSFIAAQDWKTFDGPLTCIDFSSGCLQVLRISIELCFSEGVFKREKSS